jgi:hypothetical protein
MTHLRSFPYLAIHLFNLKFVFKSNLVEILSSEEHGNSVVHKIEETEDMGSD